LKVEAERTGGTTEDGEAQSLYAGPIRPFWYLQGLRRDAARPDSELRGSAFKGWRLYEFDSEGARTCAATNIRPL
jgi:uncharacterized protein involved in copper resistance